MNIIYAEYNIHHNSISIASAFKAHSEQGVVFSPFSASQQSIRKRYPAVVAMSEPLEYARLYLDSNMQIWVDAEDSLDTVRKSIFILTTKIYTVKITQNKGNISP